MDDIKDKLVDVLRTDLPMQQMLGGTPQAPRVYPYYEPKAADVSREKPAYITFAAVGRPEAVFAVDSPVVTFMVWVGGAHGSWGLCEQIALRFRDLFHQQLYVTRTGRKLYTKIVNESDSTQNQPNFVGKNIQIRFSSSTV